MASASHVTPPGPPCSCRIRLFSFVCHHFFNKFQFPGCRPGPGLQKMKELARDVRGARIVSFVQCDRL
ncbi:hypothetical protein M5D96_009911 [Drosophila gunungcola]|uniref:Uncharacterized protein n=1 Tax=Drosophila gunungcola TaxID=103775 RepID=A0A9P9YHN5_9MUSC|nr:hypothetical protein M5D96_009911 [Drosophila gunungcola]